MFHPLASEQIQQIAKIQIKLLANRLAEKGLTLEITDDALAKVSQAGFDPVFGARPLKRAIQQSIENTLAEHILSGRVVEGETIVVDYAEDGIVVR